MASITEAFKEAVRDRVNLVDVVSRHVQLRKSGSNWMGLCPFHDDRKSPSFSVQSEKGVFHCFGCGAGGDVFEFVMRIRGLSFMEALEELAREANLPIPRQEQRPPGEMEREREERRSLLNIVEQAKEWFGQQLRGPQGKAAREYLTARGLRSATLERFQLGYAPPGWSQLVDHFGGGSAVCQVLETVGLAVHKEGRSGWYDRFRDRIIFPIHDRQGRCIAFGGRLLKGSDGPKYINSPETPLYRKGEVLYGLDSAWKVIRETEQAVVVEGYMDLISLADAGIGQVVATLGTALTEQHLRLLWGQTNRIVFCFDGDQAGIKAAWRALEQVVEGLQADRHPTFLFLPEGADPDDMIRREGVERFRQRLKESTSLLDFLLNHLSDGLQMEGPEGKAALVHRLEPYLAKVADPLLAQLYRQAVGQRLGLQGNWQQRPPSVSAPRRAAFRPPRSAVLQPVGKGRDHERLLLAILLRHPQLVLEHEESFAGLTIQDDARAKLLDALIHFGHSENAVRIAPLDYLTDGSLRRLAKAILAQEEQDLDDPERELQGCLVNCQLERIRQEMARLSANGFAEEKDWTVYHGFRQEEERLLREIKKMATPNVVPMDRH
ncbi:MAG: DNA primase [Magnetococcales bacterium]|nr:DNA primase [Magnetococcales bacterium]NGZ28628.1 DNA primase [Magnetococcales bacterium]